MQLHGVTQLEVILQLIRSNLMIDSTVVANRLRLLRLCLRGLHQYTHGGYLLQF